jgi:hypothetical protein
MNKLIGWFALCLLVTSQPTFGKEVAGIQVPDSITLAGSNTALQLNGAGIRKKFFVSVYVGALYLPDKTADTEAIIITEAPTAVDMHILHSEISKDKITGGWEDGLSANLDQAELEALRPRLDEFNKLFRSVRKGEIIRIAYLPDQGTEVRINDEWRGVVPGNDFFRALLKVWLGDKPVSKSLKQAMLGQD